MSKPAASTPTQPRGRGAVSGAVRLLAVILLFATPCVVARQQPVPPAAPATVERIVVSRQAGVTSLSLSNGIDIHLRPMPKPGTGKAVIALLVPGLELDETAATRGSTALAIDALKLPAFATHTRVRITQRPEGLLITATCPSAEIEPTLKQLAAILTDPVIDTTVLEHFRDKAVALRAAQEAEPHADHLAAEAMLRLMTPADDVRLRRPTREQLEAVKADAAAAQLKAQILSRAIDIAIVGDIDAAAITPAAALTFGMIPQRTRDRLIDLRSIKRGPPPPGQNDASAPGPRPLLSISLPAPPITDLADSRLASIAARLMERLVADALRESGLTVTIASGVAMTGRTYFNLGGVIGSFVISGDHAELRSAASIARARIAKLIDEGPTDAQLKRAIDDAAAEIEPRIETADYWSQALAMAWFLRVPIDELDTAPTTIRAATTQRIRQHAAKWWSPDQTLTVTILPAPDAAVPPLPQP